MGTALCRASETILSRWLSKNGSAGTTRPLAPSFRKETKASSKSRSVLALSTGIWMPRARADAQARPSRKSRRLGRKGSRATQSQPRRALPLSKAARSSRPISKVRKKLMPVRLLPGRLRLGTRPTRTGSLTAEKTIGIVEVAFLAASAEGSATCRKKYRHSQVNEFSHKRRQSLIAALRPAKRDGQILTFDKSRLPDASTKGCHNARRILLARDCSRTQSSASPAAARALGAAMRLPHRRAA